MKQGEIWQANLNPAKGSEQGGFRPVVILSGNLLNTYLPVVITVPLITKVKKYKGNPILQPTGSNGLKCESEILIFHIRSISKDRLVKKIGHITTEELQLAQKTLDEILKF
jgi:mRNA interferase MazF